MILKYVFIYSLNVILGWQEQQMLDDQSSSSSDNSRKTFEDLFRPPLDLIFRGNFEMVFIYIIYLFHYIEFNFSKAKFEGQRQNKWLMVNIQNPQEFACQVLNRDVWSNHAVKSILNEHFIFWQVSRCTLVYFINLIICVYN